MLHAHDIELLVDIRSFPGSRRYPHFNKESLAASLAKQGIAYKHMVALGGRRKPLQDSMNTAWRHTAFRGYADYMQTQQFQNEMMALEDLALEARTAYMCSEAPWWKCHRALVSDYLKVRGWQVWHIMGHVRATEHPFTSPARPEQGQLFYGEH